MAERTALYGARDAQREARDASMKEMKDLKSQTKFRDVGEVDRKIKALETQQSTTSMSLAKEKEVLKEIDDLKRQRKILSQTAAVSGALDGGKGASENAGASIKEINSKMSAIKTEVDALQGVLVKASEKKDKDTVYPALLKEKDALRAERKTKQDEMQKLWDGFKSDNEAFRVNQVEWEKFKKARDVAWKKEQEERKKAKAAEIKEFLATKTPYEEEMDLCDYLVNYLTTTFLDKKEAAPEAVSGGEVKLSGEFAGLTLNKSSKGGDSDYMAATGKKGLKKKGGKAGPAGAKKGKIVLYPDTLEVFGLLKMTPPAGLGDVAGAVEALEAKKAAFKAMPRGQIVSIAEMNMKIEAETDSRGSPRAAPKEGGKKGKGGGGKVDIASAEAFPSLGGAKPAAAAATTEEKK